MRLSEVKARAVAARAEVIQLDAGWSVRVKTGKTRNWLATDGKPWRSGARQAFFITESQARAFAVSQGYEVAW